MSQAARSWLMNHNERTVHVSPIGGSWEVESDTRTLGHAETRIEAMELATELAPQIGAQSIEVHTSDGRLEKQIQVGALKSGA